MSYTSRCPQSHIVSLRCIETATAIARITSLVRYSFNTLKFRMSSSATRADVLSNQNQEMPELSLAQAAINASATRVLTSPPVDTRPFSSASSHGRGIRKPYVNDVFCDVACKKALLTAFVYRSATAKVTATPSTSAVLC